MFFIFSQIKNKLTWSYTRAVKFRPINLRNHKKPLARNRRGWYTRRDEMQSHNYRGEGHVKVKEKCCKKYKKKGVCCKSCPLRELGKKKARKITEKYA